MKENHNRLDLDYVYLIPKEGIEDIENSKEIFKIQYKLFKEGLIKTLLKAHELYKPSRESSEELDGPLLFPNKRVISCLTLLLLKPLSDSPYDNIDNLKKKLEDFARETNISVVRTIFFNSIFDEKSDLELIDLIFDLIEKMAQVHANSQLKHLREKGIRIQSLYLMILPEVYYRLALIGVDPKILVLSKGNEFFSAEYFKNLIKDEKEEDWEILMANHQVNDNLLKLKISIIKGNEQEFTREMEALLESYENQGQISYFVENKLPELIELSVKSDRENILDIILNNYLSIALKQDNIDIYRTIDLKLLSRAMNIAVIRGNEGICIKLIDKLFFAELVAISVEILVDIIFFAPDSAKSYLLGYIVKNKDFIDQFYFDLSKHFLEERKVIFLKYMLPKFKFILTKNIYAAELTDKTGVIDRIINSGISKDEIVEILDHLDSEKILDMAVYKELLSTSPSSTYKINYFMKKYLDRLIIERQEILKDPEASAEELELMINSFNEDERYFVKTKREEYLRNPDGDFWKLGELLKEDEVIIEEEKNYNKSHKKKKKKHQPNKNKEIKAIIENKANDKEALTIENSIPPYDDPDAGAEAIKKEIIEEREEYIIPVHVGYNIVEQDDDDEPLLGDAARALEEDILPLFFVNEVEEALQENIAAQQINLAINNPIQEEDTQQINLAINNPIQEEDNQQINPVINNAIQQSFTLLPCSFFAPNPYENIFIPFYSSFDRLWGNIYVISSQPMLTDYGYFFIKEQISAESLFVEGSGLLENGSASYNSPNGEMFFNLKWTHWIGKILIKISDINRVFENNVSSTYNYQEAQDSKADNQKTANAAEEQKTNNRNANFEQKKENFKEVNFDIKTKLEIKVKAEDSSAKEKRESLEAIKSLENSTFAKVNYEELLTIEKYDFPTPSFFGSVGFGSHDI
jgi:hypothetical protein